MDDCSYLVVPIEGCSLVLPMEELFRLVLPIEAVWELVMSLPRVLGFALVELLMEIKVFKYEKY